MILVNNNGEVKDIPDDTTIDELVSMGFTRIQIREAGFPLLDGGRQ